VATAQYDPAGARALLAQAGYANGLELTLTVCPCRPGAYVQQLAELLQRQLAAVGVKANIDLVASSSEFEANRRGKYEAFILDTRPVIVDPIYSAALDHRTAPAGLQNFDAYSNPRLDKLVNAGLVTSDGPRRNRYILGVEQTLAADVPWVKLVETPGRHAFRSNVTGYGPSPTGGLYIEELAEK
jgi:peptide/nickel transport system substrate-binding protein